MKEQDHIRIENLVVSCIIGNLPEERLHPQPLHVTAEATLDLTDAGERADLERSIDYARVSQELRFLLETSRFHLLESAALTLCRHLLLAGASAASVSLHKPQALGGHGVPSVHMTRRAPGPKPDAQGRVTLLQSPSLVIEHAPNSLPQEVSGAWTRLAVLPTTHGMELRVRGLPE